MTLYLMPGEPEYDCDDMREAYTRIVDCPACGGNGGWEDRPIAPSGSGHWFKCSMCNGEREIELPCDPMTFDDMEDAFGF